MGHKNFNISHYQLETLAEELDRFATQQIKFKIGDTVVDEMSSDWDHHLSAASISNIEDFVVLVQDASRKLKLIDSLLGQDISESSFLLDWKSE